MIDKRICIHLNFKQFINILRSLKYFDGKHRFNDNIEKYCFNLYEAIKKDYLNNPRKY